jgi:type II secretory pathway pseudopilin PulG
MMLMTAAIIVGAAASIAAAIAIVFARRELDKAEQAISLARSAISKARAELEAARLAAFDSSHTETSANCREPTLPNSVRDNLSRTAASPSDSSSSNNLSSIETPNVGAKLPAEAWGG